MVNNLFIRLLTLPVRPLNTAKLKIADGPIYDLDVAQAIIRAAMPDWQKAVWVGNESATEALINDFFPPWDEDEVPSLLLALTKEDRTGSEWTKTSNGMWVDCDVYEVGYHRNKRERWVGGPLVYVKWGMARNKAMCIVVRIHPSRNTRRK